MQPAKLTYHAAQRLNQRCTLPPIRFKAMLDQGATVQLSQQRGGKLVHRLMYSLRDEAWFVAVQDGNDGDVLTTLPLAYFENFHGKVSGLNRRRARKLAREFEANELAQEKARATAKRERLQKEEEARQAKLTAKEEEALAAQARKAAGWKITVQFQLEGNVSTRTIGRTMVEYGDPDAWAREHPIHVWFRERLDAACISVLTIRGIWLERAKNQMPGDVLLEHLIMTEEEVQKLR